MAQHDRGERLESEMNMKEAMGLMGWNSDGARTVRRTIKLEKWLREWGKEDEADGVRRRIDGLLDAEGLDCAVSG